MPHIVVQLLSTDQFDKKIDVFPAKTVRTTRKLMKNFRESTWFVTGGLISESFFTLAKISQNR